jgi:hypothetical protein
MASRQAGREVGKRNKGKETEGQKNRHRWIERLSDRRTDGQED